MTRDSGIRRVLLALLLVSACALPAGPFAWAQDGKKKGDDAEQPAEETPKEKTAEQKALEKIGKEFAAKDVSALLARVKEKGKIRLSMGRHDKTYGRDQAKTVLEGWFEKRAIKELKLKPNKDTTTLTGTFTLTFRRRTKPKPEVVDLEIRMKKDGDAFLLKSIRVMPQ